MTVESFLVTALPFSAQPNFPRHISLFVTHRLTPDAGGSVVGDFPHVRNWTARLAGAQFVVTGHVGATAVPIPVTAHLDELDPSLWNRVFPRRLPVLPWQTPDPAARQWRTYPAHRSQIHALMSHMASILSSAVAPPSVSANRFATTLLTELYDLRRMTIEELLDDPDALDERVTRRLDALVGRGKLTSGFLEDQGGASAALLLATDAHLARLYYSRPEEQHPYRAEPDPQFTAKPVEQPPPDFHRRASLIGDLSPLLRKLGLIVDLRVDDLNALAGVTDIAGDITIPGLANPIPAQPRIACEVAGTSFTAVSATGDYTRGMLRIGDETAFTLLDLDPDASSLKLEQYVRNLPRMLATEANGDKVNSAPSTLRGTGFAIARVDRAQQMRDRLTGAPATDATVIAGHNPPLHLEDVARGVRLEVWDDVSQAWHSLHRRRLRVDVRGGGTVLDDAPDTGFLQGASLTSADGVAGAPVHAHEVLAGWDGWSLSAPRPGLRVVHDRGEEKVEQPADPAPDAKNPVASTTRVEPGTLPRLRYGRNYTFRAWAVDLAGNSPVHTVVGPEDAGDGGVFGAKVAEPLDNVSEVAARVAADRLGAVPDNALAAPGRAGAVTDAAVEAIRARLVEPPQIAKPSRGAPVGVLTSVTGHGELDRLILARRTPDQPPTQLTGRQVRIEDAVRDVLPELPGLARRTDAGVPTEVFASALAAAALANPHLSEDAAAAALADVAELLTTPRPFLRWDPVLEPTVVPRRRYTEGESLLTLVIRSGVDGPGPDGVSMTLVPPDEYAAQVKAAHPGLQLRWRADAQRHLLPPKTTQFECELHGLFDDAFGSNDNAAIRKALAISLREAGTLTDTTVADLDRPGARIPQPGVKLVTGPTADPPETSNPDELERGAGLSRGQYVIHDTDTVVVPYLPDPLADGVSFVFPDAGKGTALGGLLAVEGTHLAYGGEWPDRTPWRLVLTSGAQLAADAQDGVVALTMPAGNQLRMRLSSALVPDSLDLLGIWRSLPVPLQQLALLREAAVDGWLWWLTPATELRLVHAVPRPLEAPRITLLTPLRGPGDTSTRFLGGIDLHGPSTDRLDLEASWTEWIDDVAEPAPKQVSVQAAVGHVQIEPDEDLAVLFTQDNQVTLPDGTVVRLHALEHKFGDTKHRNVQYRARAATRFREYFDPHIFATIDDSTVLGPAKSVNVPSAARPGKPAVRDVLPLLRWHEETEAGQPFAVSRTRGCGLRIYLDRPWYQTGDDELLGVVLQSGDKIATDAVSLWGGDPIFEQELSLNRAAVPLTDVVHSLGIDDRARPGRPVGIPAQVTLIDVPGTPQATVLGYAPEFSPDRRLWFVDVALDPGTAFWPFVRLSVARYQPNALAGLELSPILNCDFAQLLPPRTMLVSRPDDRHVRVVVTGPVNVPGYTAEDGSFTKRVEHSRALFARLERRVPAVNTDLGWTVVAAARLPVQGVSGPVVSWEGALELSRSVEVKRPGTNRNWRVVVEEVEALPADPAPGLSELIIPRFGRRVVYADRCAL